MVGWWTTWQWLCFLLQWELKVDCFVHIPKGRSCLAFSWHICLGYPLLCYQKHFTCAIGTTMAGNWTASRFLLLNSLHVVKLYDTLWILWDFVGLFLGFACLLWTAEQGLTSKSLYPPCEERLGSTESFAWGNNFDFAAFRGLCMQATRGNHTWLLNSGNFSCFLHWNLPLEIWPLPTILTRKNGKHIPTDCAKKHSPEPTNCHTVWRQAHQLP